MRRMTDVGLSYLIDGGSDIAMGRWQRKRVGDHPCVRV